MIPSIAPVESINTSPNLPSLLARLGERTTLRLSFAPYNSPQDVDAFFAALDKSLELLAC